MKFDAAQIARATGGTVIRAAGAGPIHTDTRTLPPGSWFLALVGPRFDGHDHVARAEGAVGAVVERIPEGYGGGLVQVADTERALQDLGRAARDRVHGPVIGLTGSSGKTTTRALLALALAPLGRVHQTEGNLNNHLGVPLTLLAAPEEAAAVVVEMGTSSPGEIGLLAEIARPDARLLLNVGPAHLEELGGLDGVAREKGALFASARPGDLLAINLDDPRVAALPLPDGVRAIRWGRNPLAEVRLLEATLDPDALAMDCRWRVGGVELQGRVPAPGEHVALDATAALAVAVGLGVDARAAVQAMQGYAPVGMRLRVEPVGEGVTAINDAYNANPQSMFATLDLLASLPGRTIAVLGDMLELGADEALWHQRVADHAQRAGVGLVVLVGPRMAATAGDPAWRFADPMEAVEPLAEALRAGDRVLFKGSRGARVERILHALQASRHSGER